MLQEPSLRRDALQFAFELVHSTLSKTLVSRAAKVPLLEGSSSFALFQSCTDVLLLGVTDVWSAIRRDCARRAAAFALEMPSIEAVDWFCDRLLRVAAGTERISHDKLEQACWGERDGALLTLSLLLKAIRVEKRAPDAQELSSAKTDSSADSSVASDIRGGFASADTGVMFRFGSRNARVARLPRALVQTLKSVLYQCLRHDQVSVRTNAAQCLKHYVDLCDEPTRLLIFQEVVSKLNRMKETNSVVDSELLEASEAEGLLDVLAKLAPSLPARFLLKHWKFVFPTLERYVTHIASSVRQKSSTVVLALARLSQAATKRSASDLGESASDTAALELLLAMMRSLSEFESAASDLCWQRAEGRLLSIETLVNVLATDLLFFQFGTNVLHVSGDESCSRSASTQDVQATLSSENQWAVLNAPAATWTIDEDELAEMKKLSSLRSSDQRIDHATQSSCCLIDALDRLMLTKNEAANAPGRTMWHRVLDGWFRQTHLAFASNQFELRRISRQVLPGLVRLSLWTHCFASAYALASEAWRWTCTKLALLHLALLTQSIGAKRTVNSNDKLSMMIDDGSEAVWSFVSDPPPQAAAEQSSQDAEATVVRAEAQLIAFLSYSHAPKRLATALELLERSLTVVLSHLPPHFQLEQLASDCRVRGDTSLDRQLSIVLVRMLPVIAAKLRAIAKADARERDAQSTKRWTTCWRVIERASLAWLATDDMFRWITVSQRDAQSSLLTTLDCLLQCVPDSAINCATEFALLLTQLNTAFLSENSRGRASDASLVQVLTICLRVWKHSQSSGATAQRQSCECVVRAHALLATAASATQGSKSDATSSWDDWDADDDHVDDPKTSEPQTTSGTTECVSELSLADSTVTWAISAWARSDVDALRGAIAALGSAAACGDERTTDALLELLLAQTQMDG